MELLFKTLNQRKRPEDVAQMIVDILGDKLNSEQNRIIEKAAQNSLKNNFWGYTHMAQEFVQPVGAKRQMNKASQLFNIDIESLDPNNPDHILRLIQTISAVLKKTVGENNFKTDRPNKEQRKAANIDLSKRAYNKRWRLIKRLENRLLKYSKECTKLEFQKISKHGIIHRVTKENFLKDTDSACFVAYYTARCNLRSEFTVDGQQRPFDEISQMLFQRCLKNTTTNWYLIAHVYPNIEVLTHLSDQQKGELLGTWTSILQDIAKLLKELWQTNDINRQTMIVKKGNDSTTWNNTAGAWNKSRDNWINLIYAIGMDEMLDSICFGKVLRLMAGDVAWWHMSIGNKLDPNTQVWNKLPLPWEVFDGTAQCNRNTIREVCKMADIDPEKSGWIAPREHKVVPFKPTPELVHGVTVHNPFLAQILKQHRYFSGKH